MKYSSIACIALLSIPLMSFAETVTTTDGRTIVLNEDGTYVIQETISSSVDEYLTLLDPLFMRHVSEYDQKSIRFMPKVTNKSSQAIVGVRFTSSFRDAFGDEVFAFSGDMNERVAPGGNSTANVFYVFEDNPFMGGQPYDKLLPMISGNTGSIVTRITGIALDGGDVVKFE